MSIVQVAFVNPLINELCMYNPGKRIMTFSLGKMFGGVMVPSNDREIGCSTTVRARSHHCASVARQYN